MHQKKYRKQNGLFIVEGIKSIREFINSDYLIDSLYYTPQISPQIHKITANINLFEISETDLAKISVLQCPQDVLALVQIPRNESVNFDSLKGKYSLVLDEVQDPGNLGTIIRTADWFGIENIICSPTTVDAYNPKTVQSTMGSLARTRVIYTDLEVFLANSKLPIYGAELDGENIYQVHWKPEGLIILGNEGHGIDPLLSEYISHSVTIPRIGEAESLNVAISAAIFCSELQGRLFK